ncbi:DUF4446 family protein [Nitriliruptor alkaliphilus]|uniref:DUF4446 family protein n=1 Tax=Nitriliruptor alkaliphilus TaxID=427918 RepID=UPI000697AE87|nr:DUF4446 family protein [Nitriliruptor alkaliphilus]
MLDLDPQVTATLAVAACAAAAVLLLVVLLLALRLRRLVRDHRRAIDPERGEDVIAVLGRHEETLAAIGRDVRALDARSGELREVLRGTVSQVGMVRYDAFEDMGGALSFSAALLDERGDGIVLSAINGRTETRCYAKAVTGGTSEHNLSVEEDAAIRTALAGGGVGEAPVPARRRRRSS